MNAINCVIVNILPTERILSSFRVINFVAMAEVLNVFADTFGLDEFDIYLCPFTYGGTSAPIVPQIIECIRDNLG